MKKTTRKKLNFIIKAFFPDKCPFCGDVYEGGICPDCRKKIPYVKEPLCKKCGKPLDDETKEYCADCMKTVHAFTQGRAVYVHRPPVSEAVYILKYHNARIYGEYFAKEMAEQYGSWIRRNKIQVIIPVPLHKKRRRERGYNQAGLLAGALAKRLGIPYCDDLVERVRETTRQKLLGAKERRTNLQGAFIARKNLKKKYHILVVDDIYTTGNTLDGVTKALKRAGAGDVYCLTVSIGQGD